MRPQYPAHAEAAGQKRCLRCRQLRPLALFHNNIRPDDLRCPYCTPCKRAKRTRPGVRAAELAAQRRWRARTAHLRPYRNAATRYPARDGRKRCTGCLVDQPVAAFTRAFRSADGFGERCLACRRSRPSVQPLARRRRYAIGAAAINARRRARYAEDGARRRAASTAYYRAHRDQVRDRQRAHRSRTRIVVNADQRYRRVVRGEEIRSRDRAYYASHREMINARRRERAAQRPAVVDPAARERQRGHERRYEARHRDVRNRRQRERRAANSAVLLSADPENVRRRERYASDPALARRARERARASHERRRAAAEEAPCPGQ